MRRACIDIGSNTTRLLVADCDDRGLVEVRQERAFTSIGQSLTADGEIPEAKLDEVVRAVSGQLSLARRLAARDIRCVGTAGVRRAANGERLVEMVSRYCSGLRVEVLSGEDEARLAFIGAAWGLSRSGNGWIEGSLGVVDVGGGSSELVVGTPPDSIIWSESLAIGSSDLVGSYLVSDPPSADEFARASGRVREMFADVRPPAVRAVVAVGGSAASLTRMVGPNLDPEALRRSLELLANVPAAALAARYEIDPQRVRLLPAGLLILDQIAEIFGVPMVVGSAGLREGVLLDST